MWWKCKTLAAQIETEESQASRCDGKMAQVCEFILKCLENVDNVSMSEWCVDRGEDSVNTF